jgi:hypothetical protein
MGSFWDKHLIIFVICIGGSFWSSQFWTAVYSVMVTFMSIYAGYYSSGNVECLQDGTMWLSLGNRISDTLLDQGEKLLVRRHPTVSQNTNYNAIMKEKYIKKIIGKQNGWLSCMSLLYFSDCFSIRSCLSSKNIFMNSAHYLMCLFRTRYQMEVSNKSCRQEMKWV